MYAQERQQHILGEARRAGRVDVLTLAESLGVAAETIRRDLTVLERRGTLRRVHGGAIPVERFDVEPSLAVRTERLTAEKRRIAARALQELPSDGTILIDSGTTTLALAEMLPADLSLTVMTNSIGVAALLAGHEHLNLYLLGGRVRGRTGAAVGHWATDALDGIFVDVAFIGTNGFSVSRGLTTPDQSESLVKVAMVGSARRTILLADSTKAGDDHLHRFAQMRDVALLITDTDIDPEVVDEIADTGPEVVLA